MKIFLAIIVLSAFAFIGFTHTCKHIFVYVTQENLEPFELGYYTGGKEIVCIKCHLIKRQKTIQSDYTDGVFQFKDTLFIINPGGWVDRTPDTVRKSIKKN